MSCPTPLSLTLPCRLRLAVETGDVCLNTKYTAPFRKKSQLVCINTVNVILIAELGKAKTQTSLYVVLSLSTQYQ